MAAKEGMQNANVEPCAFAADDVCERGAGALKAASCGEENGGDEETGLCVEVGEGAGECVVGRVQDAERAESQASLGFRGRGGGGFRGGGFGGGGGGSQKGFGSGVRNMPATNTPPAAGSSGESVKIKTRW